MRCPVCSKELAQGSIKCNSCGFTLGTDNIKDKIEMIKLQNSIAKPDRKDWLTTLLLCIFFGLLGVHRFYTGNKKIGIWQLVTSGGMGLWVLIDLILILTDSYRDGYGNSLAHK